MAGLYDDIDYKLEDEDVGQLKKDVEANRKLLVAAETINDASQETIRILERNMSALFTTARLEVKRKDDEIIKLRKLLERERRIVTSTQEALECYLERLQTTCARVIAAAKAVAETGPPVAAGQAAPGPGSAPADLRQAVVEFERLAAAPFTEDGFTADTGGSRPQDGSSRAADARDRPAGGAGYGAPAGQAPGHGSASQSQGYGGQGWQGAGGKPGGQPPASSSGGAGPGRARSRSRDRVPEQRDASGGYPRSDWRHDDRQAPSAGYGHGPHGGQARQEQGYGGQGRPGGGYGDHGPGHGQWQGQGGYGQPAPNWQGGPQGGQGPYNSQSMPARGAGGYGQPGQYGQDQRQGGGSIGGYGGPPHRDRQQPGGYGANYGQGRR